MIATCTRKRKLKSYWCAIFDASNAVVAKMAKPSPHIAPTVTRSAPRPSPSTDRSGTPAPPTPGRSATSTLVASSCSSASVRRRDSSSSTAETSAAGSDEPPFASVPGSLTARVSHDRASKASTARGRGARPAAWWTRDLRGTTGGCIAPPGVPPRSGASPAWASWPPWCSSRRSLRPTPPRASPRRAPRRPRQGPAAAPRRARRRRRSHRAGRPARRSSPRRRRRATRGWSWSSTRGRRGGRPVVAVGPGARAPRRAVPVGDGQPPRQGRQLVPVLVRPVDAHDHPVRRRALRGR